MQSQAWIVAELVAKRLRVEVEAEARSEAVRSLAAGAARPLAESIAEAASHLRITFLSRELSADDMARLITEAAFPAVLLHAGRDEGDVLVVTGRRDTVAQATLIASDGTSRPVELELTGLRDRARAGAIRALLPVEVGPYVGVQATDRELSPLQRTLRLLHRERGDIGLVYLFAALVGLFSLTLPLAVQMIVQLVQGGLFLQPVALLIAFVVAGTLASGAMGVAQMRVVETLQQRVFARVALELGFKVPRLPFERSLNNALPETMNRFFEVIVIQKSLLKLLTGATTALLQVLFGLVLLTFYHPYFTIFGALLLLGLYLILRLTGPRGLETSIIESKYKYRAVHWLQEMARAITAFKFSGASTMPVDRMDDLVTGYLRYRRKHFRVLLQQAWAIIAFKALITAGLLVLGTALVVSRQITLGQFVASELVIVTVLAGLEKLVTSMSTVYDLLTAVDKLGAVSDLPIESPGGLVPAAAPVGFALELRQVSYAYPGSTTRVLRGINLGIRPGERVALLGPDGSGQSTLLRVLSGLLDDYQGTVTYDGITLRDLDRRALRGQVGQMLSLHDLFDGTIEENVTVGRPDISTTQVLRALADARLDRHVQGLPQGLRTTVSAGGGSLSVSNAKKLLLAQALVGPPRLLVLEDIVQHLEGEDRIRVIEMLCDRARPWTLLVVTPDPLFLSACDRVVVLDDGEVVLEGPYDRIADHPRLRELVPALSRAA
ncbi:MAG: transporter ATP-binding/permease protein [Gemmatimonadetes bacterium]|nr:transporter ATP-binding/permease protein [Gemmatimonadota bacterium]